MDEHVRSGPLASVAGPDALRLTSRRMAVRRGAWPAAALVAAMLAILLPGCSSEGSGDASTTSAAPTTGLPRPQVDPAEWSEEQCPEGVRATPPVTLRCGIVVVPEDHGANDDGPGDAAARTVELPVALLDPGAEFARPDPVVFVDGGPGSDGLSNVSLLSTTGFAGTHVVIVVGQRGTRFGTPSLDCPELDEHTRGHYDEDLGTDAARRTRRAALRDCAARVREPGIDLANFDTAAAAEDLEVVRRVLGYEWWNLHGVSYGTRVVLESLRRHPEHARSAVLDSVVPAEVDTFGSLVPNARRAFEAVADACRSDAACAASNPDLLGRLAALYERLEHTPLDVSDTNPATGDTVTVRWDGDRMARAAYNALYDSSLVPVLPALLSAFERDDASLAVSTYLRRAEDGMTRLAEGLFHNVTCRERAPLADRAEIEDLRDDSPPWLLAAVGGLESLDECDDWPVEPADPALSEPVRSAVPTLVLAGGFDPVTPPEWGRTQSAAQEAAFFVEFATYGHAVGFEPCARDMIGWFLDEPTIDPDRTCLLALPATPTWVPDP